MKSGVKFQKIHGNGSPHLLHEFWVENVHTKEVWTKKLTTCEIWACKASIIKKSRFLPGFIDFSENFENSPVHAGFWPLVDFFVTNFRDRLIRGPNSANKVIAPISTKKHGKIMIFRILHLRNPIENEKSGFCSGIFVSWHTNALERSWGYKKVLEVIRNEF